MARDALSPFRIADLTGEGFGRDRFLSFRREMNSLLDDVFHGQMTAAGGESPTLMPQIDVSETGRELMISAELPGRIKVQGGSRSGEKAKWKAREAHQQRKALGLALRH